MDSAEKKTWCHERIQRMNCKALEEATGIPAGALRQFRNSFILGYERIELLYNYLAGTTAKPPQPMEDAGVKDLMIEVLKLQGMVRDLRDDLKNHITTCHHTHPLAGSGK